MTLIKKFIRDESGATAIEYGLIAALISVAAIVALNYLGDELYNVFNYIACALGTGQKSSGAVGCQ
ncbi:Flp family type IVb pilin [bacterium]|nr:Flp family type IVb pilin [bacterium]